VLGKKIKIHDKRMLSKENVLDEKALMALYFNEKNISRERGACMKDFFIF
jgi:hypothetical protein